MKIEGKTALVIGGVQGIGKASVEALLDKGAKVSIVTISSTHLASKPT